MADSSDVDAALVTKLEGDAQLMAICTDGIFWDIGGHNATRFVRISQIAHDDEPMFGATAFEDFEYAVIAVVLNTTGADVKAASARIYAVLHNQSLTVSGYSLMRMHRVGRIRYTDDDAVNLDARWQNRGGRYAVTVSA